MNETAAAKPIAADERDVAEYIAALSHDLALLAQRAKMPVLAYLLEMARVEAMRQVNANSMHQGG